MKRGGMGKAYHLLGHHDYGFGRESSVAMIEQVFQRGSQEVNDEDIVKTLLTKIIDIRDSSY